MQCVLHRYVPHRDAERCSPYIHKKYTLLSVEAFYLLLYTRLIGGTDWRPAPLLAALFSSKPLGRPLRKSFLCLLSPSHRYISILACTVHPAGPKPFLPGSWREQVGEDVRTRAQQDV